MPFKFKASVVIEASSVEDALNKLGSRISAISRHVSNGEKLEANEPFFELTQVAGPATEGALSDPIVTARNAAAAQEPKDEDVAG